MFDLLPYWYYYISVLNANVSCAGIRVRKVIIYNMLCAYLTRRTNEGSENYYLENDKIAKYWKFLAYSVAKL